MPTGLCTWFRTALLLAFLAIAVRVHGQWDCWHYDQPGSSYSQVGISLRYVNDRYQVLFQQSANTSIYPLQYGLGLMQVDANGQPAYWDHWTDSSTFFYTNERGRMQATADNGSLVIGVRRFQDMDDSLTVRRLDQFGTTLWERTYSDPDYTQHGTEVVETTDGHLMLVGVRAAPSSAMRAFVWKLTADGEPVWQVHYTAPLGRHLSAIAPTTDGGCIVGGSLNYNTCNSHAWLTRLAADGSELWSTTHGGPFLDRITHLHVLPNEEVIVSGYSGVACDNFSSHDMWLARYSSSGDLLWQQHIGIPNNHYFRAMRVLGDEPAIFGVGSWREGPTYKGLACKYSLDGDSIWCRSLEYNDGETYGGWGWLNDITQGTQGTLAVTGDVMLGTGTAYDIWFMLLDEEGLPMSDPSTLVQGSAPAHNRVHCFPNPAQRESGCTCASSDLKGTWLVYDALGRTVHGALLEVSTTAITLHDLEPGLYSVVFASEHRSFTQRVLIQ